MIVTVVGINIRNVSTQGWNGLRTTVKNAKMKKMKERKNLCNPPPTFKLIFKVEFATTGAPDDV